MKQLMHNPWLWFGAYYVFSSIVSGMPAPDDKSGAGYKWAYGSLHTLAGNIGNLMKNGKAAELAQLASAAQQADKKP